MCLLRSATKTIYKVKTGIKRLLSLYIKICPIIKYDNILAKYLTLILQRV